MKNYLIAIIFIIILASIFIISHFNDKNFIDRINKEYPRIEIIDSINGMVLDIHKVNRNNFRNDPHHAFVTIHDTVRGTIVKKSIHVSFEKNTGRTLDNILSIGDYIYKRVDTNIIRIRNNVNTINFEFEITNESGYPLRKDSSKVNKD